MTDEDDQFAEAFRRTIGTVGHGDTDAALARVTSRSRTVRRRRTATRVGVLLAAAASVGVLWIAVRPADDTTVDTVDAPTTGALSTTPGTVTSAPVTPTTTTAPTAPTVATTTPGSLDPSTPPPTGTAPSSTPTGATTAPTTPTIPATSPPSSGPVTYSGQGGSMTVRVDAGALVVVRVQPAAGFDIEEQKADADDAEVRFESDAGATTRIRVELEDGALVPEIDEG